MDGYFENFKFTQDIIDQYAAAEDALDGAIIHLAWYGYGSYCGKSLVIFEKNGVLYEVNGFHCSCNGLEGQWEPEETSWSALKMRDVSGECDGSGEAQEYLQNLIVERELTGS